MVLFVLNCGGEPPANSPDDGNTGLPPFPPTSGGDQGGNDIPIAGNGGCSASSSVDYSEAGPYKFTTTRSGSYEVYLPTATADCNRFPLIGFSLGTAMPAFNYTSYFRHFASWGYVVAIDPSNLLNLGGGSLKTMLSQVRSDNRIAGNLNEKTGIIGHSQGGAAVVNVAMGNNPRIDAVVGLMPALFTGTGSISGAGLFLGGTSDLFSVATDPQGPYNKTSGPAFIGDVQGAGHNTGLLGGGSNRSFQSASAAWFRCYLSGDANACSKFEQSARNKKCVFPGTWAKCEGKNL